jgi:hypothetical protein
MTGLDPDTDAVIEIYCLVTDAQLELLDENGWGTVVHQTRERMAMMDEWCTRVRTSAPSHPPTVSLGAESIFDCSLLRTVISRSKTRVDNDNGQTARVALRPP